MKEFGDLLRAGRKRSFDKERGKPLTQERLGELVGQEVDRYGGYSGVMVSNWERGKNQINKDDRDVLVSLVKVLHECGGLRIAEEANELLRAGNYRSLDAQEQSKIFPTEQVVPPEPTTKGTAGSDKAAAPVPHSLPDKRYRELVGRETLVDEIINALQDSHNRKMVGIDGMGGIGKTALAYEVAERCLKEGDFDGLVWASASRSDMGSGEGAGSGGLTFESVLDTIGRQLGVPEIAKLKIGEKPSRVQFLLKRQRILVVLDNLETAAEPQNQIARQLQALLGATSKALLTSRNRFSGDMYLIHLTGLDQSKALPLIHQIAEEKGIPHIATADPAELAEIAETTGGSPLALQLVVSLLDYLPLDIVLEHLRQVKPLSDDLDEDEYIRFYKSIFLRSWKLLSEQSQQLLISMAHFVPGIGADFEDALIISALERDLFTPSIRQLWRLSFLEIGQVPNLKQIHYYLHALTQYFVLADIVQIL